MAGSGDERKTLGTAMHCPCDSYSLNHLQENWPFSIDNKVLTRRDLAWSSLCSEVRDK